MQTKATQGELRSAQPARRSSAQADEMQAQPRIAVMIVTDQPIMRDGLRLRIQQEADMLVVCEAGDLVQTLRDFHLCRPDVLVIDLQSPLGARAVKAMRGISPGTPWVLLTDDPQEVVARLRNEGCIALVPKMLAKEQVIPAIRGAISESRGSGTA